MSDTAPVRTLSQSCSVFGSTVIVPFLVTVVPTASNRLSAIGSIMYFISSLTDTIGLRSPHSIAATCGGGSVLLAGAGVGPGEEHPAIVAERTISPAHAAERNGERVITRAPVRRNFTRPAASAPARSRGGPTAYPSASAKGVNLLDEAGRRNRAAPAPTATRVPTGSRRPPTLRAFERVLPARAQLADSCGRHRRLEAAIGSPLTCGCIAALPEPDGQSGKVRRTQRGRLGNLRADDRRTDQVRLELHQEIVPRRAAVHTQLGQPDAGVRLHGVEQIGRLKSDRLERGACDVAGAGAARQADDRPARVRIPVRRAEPRERWNEIHIAVVGNRHRERLDVRRRSNDAETVAQPLDDRAGDEDAPFERVLRGSVARPGDGRQQLVARRGRRGAGVLQHEAARSVGVLRQAGRRAHLPEQRRLLIAGDAAQDDGLEPERRPHLTVDLARAAYDREDAARYVQRAQQVVVPLERVDVEQQGA